MQRNGWLSSYGYSLGSPRIDAARETRAGESAGNKWRFIFGEYFPRRASFYRKRFNHCKKIFLPIRDRAPDASRKSARPGEVNVFAPRPSNASIAVLQRRASA